MAILTALATVVAVLIALASLYLAWRIWLVVRQARSDFDHILVSPGVEKDGTPKLSLLGQFVQLLAMQMGDTMGDVLFAKLKASDVGTRGATKDVGGGNAMAGLTAIFGGNPAVAEVIKYIAGRENGGSDSGQSSGNKTDFNKFG